MHHRSCPSWWHIVLHLDFVGYRVGPYFTRAPCKSIASIDIDLGIIASINLVSFPHDHLQVLVLRDLARVDSFHRPAEAVRHPLGLIWLEPLGRLFFVIAGHGVEQLVTTDGVELLHGARSHPSVDACLLLVSSNNTLVSLPLCCDAKVEEALDLVLVVSHHLYLAVEGLLTLLGPHSLGLSLPGLDDCSIVRLVRWCVPSRAISE